MRRGQKKHLTSTWADSCDSIEVRMHMGLDTCSGLSRVMVVISFSSWVWTPYMREHVMNIRILCVFLVQERGQESPPR